MKHSFLVRVYYEDTDAAGVVYYANYLKFIERARTELLHEIGVGQRWLRETHGISFVVRTLQAKFASPARLDDELRITSAVRKVTGARVLFDQRIQLDDRLVFRADIELACVTSNGVASRIPDLIRKHFSDLLEASPEIGARNLSVG